MRRPEGVSLVALYFFAMSIPSLIGACCILAGAVSAGFNVDDFDFGIFAGISALVILLLLAFGLGIVFFVTAIGLWGVRMWARWLAVIISILSLFAFPVGTVIGGVTIWYLFQEQTKETFEAAGKPAESLLDELVDEMEELMEYPEPEEPESSDGAEEAEEVDEPSTSEDSAEEEA